MTNPLINNPSTNPLNNVWAEGQVNNPLAMQNPLGEMQVDEGSDCTNDESVTPTTSTQSNLRKLRNISANKI